MNLAITLAGVKMANPLVLASGFLGVTGANLAAVIRAGAGAVTTKSIWFARHDGHVNPTVLDLGGGNLINAVGLPHGGMDEAREEIANYRRLTKAPLFASIVAAKTDEFEAVAREVVALKPDLIELNISCPNVEDEFGTPFACEPQLATRATAAAKKVVGNIPLAVKLSPNVRNIGEIAKAVEAAGAGAITAINTVGPGMVIDIETRTPILANKVGGLSGPAIRPLAVKYIWDIHRAVKLPIIGTGGVMTGRDAIELMLAGATAVGLGSAITTRGVDVFAKINAEIATWCKTHKITDLKELVGAAHRS